VTKKTGEVVAGESAVRAVGGAVGSVALTPAAPRSLPEVREALLAADLIVLGPGSLVTSTILPLLVPEVAAALAESRAQLVYVSNIMTEAGETDGFDAFDHVAALEAHGSRRPDLVLVNSEPVGEQRVTNYLLESASVVDGAAARFADAGIPVINLPLIASGETAKHDSVLLANALMRIAREARTNGHLVHVHQPAAVA